VIGIIVIRGCAEEGLELLAVAGGAGCILELCKAVEFY